MAEFYVVNASVAEPLIATLMQISSKTERVIERCGLNAGLVEAATGLIPLHAGEKMLIETQRLMGPEDFVFETVAAHASTSDTGIANIPVEYRNTGFDAVRAFVVGLDGVLTGTRFFLEVGADSFWIRRTTSTTEFSDDWAVVQYNLSIILNGMRALFGPNVAAIAAEAASVKVHSRLPEDLQGIPIRFAAPFTGLAFPCKLLAANLTPENVEQTKHRSSYQFLAEPRLHHLEGCIAGLLGSENESGLAERTAKAFGMSVRTYHRRLSQQGANHGKLVANARIRMAKEYLTAESATITEIAFELGYRYPGDFARFFRQRTGMTPSQYRIAATIA